MKKNTGTQISYYHLCHRKLWLHANGITMEHTSHAVAEGKLIDETTYTHRTKKWKELDLGHVKIDHYDTSTSTIREVKKSPKLEHAHISQVKYYLYALKQKGVADAKGLIEYPKQKKTTEVVLTPKDIAEIQNWEAEIQRIVTSPGCPPLVVKGYCKKCAFMDFCYV